VKTPLGLTLAFVFALSAQAAYVINVDAGGWIPMYPEPPPGGTQGLSLFYFRVAGLPPVVQDINVRISIEHTYVSDLDVWLVSPLEEMTVTLFTDVGGSGQNFQDTLLDDQATTPIGSGTAPFIGSYIPQEPLAAFNGLNPNGIWQLIVVDDAGGDYGRLFKAGEMAPWGPAIGTQLIIDAVPEPGSLGLLLLLGTLLRRR